MTKIRFIKLDASANELPPAAESWDAVLDTMQRLIWTRADVKVQNYGECESAIATLQGTAGFTDFRMPTIEELFLLADRTRHLPAIDTDFFPGAHNDWYWSSTPAAHSPGDCAWFVDFDRGNAFWVGHGVDGFVRGVRPGQ